MSVFEEKNTNSSIPTSVSKRSTEIHKTSIDLVDALTEKNIILQALEEGVFFLNQNLQLAGEYSSSLEILIDQKLTPGQNFQILLENRVPDNIINNTHEFLSLMFRSDLDETTIRELNPLQSVEFHYENRWGLWTSSKYLSFKFKRVIKEKEVIKLICTVKDITKPVTLTKKLDEFEEITKRQMEWLVNILRVAPPLLNEFIDVSEIEMQCIDKELKNSRGTTDSKPLLNKILRAVHQLRSNATLLNLNFFTEKIKAFEVQILKIKNKNQIIGSDFVPAVIQLGEIRRMIADVKKLMQQFKHFSQSLRPTRRYESGLLMRTIENLVKNLSSQLGKRIKFKSDLFDNSIIPYSDQQIVREFLVILTRFSIFYGIEKPEERKTNNKDPLAMLEIESFADKRIFGFKLRHDGRLIRIERLLQKTIESTEAEASEEVKQHSSYQLGSEVIRLLFMPSIATSNLSEAEFSKEIFNEMEMVKKKLKMHGGKIKITFTSENFCEYTISLPRK
jgi:two-component system chemotaxis sensor kinase CheA